MIRKGIAAFILAPLFALGSTGCFMTVADPMMVGVYGPPVEYGYQPLLYDGYVVYYTDAGMPFYWIGGTRAWIPHHARPRYVAHWQHYKPAYRKWYNHRGHSYQSQRFTDHDHRPGRTGSRSEPRPKYPPQSYWEYRPEPRPQPQPYREHRSQLGQQPQPQSYLENRSESRPQPQPQPYREHRSQLGQQPQPQPDEEGRSERRRKYQQPPDQESGREPQRGSDSYPNRDRRSERSLGSDGSAPRRQSSENP